MDDIGLGFGNDSDGQFKRQSCRFNGGCGRFERSMVVDKRKCEIMSYGFRNLN